MDIRIFLLVSDEVKYQAAFVSCGGLDQCWFLYSLNSSNFLEVHSLYWLCFYRVHAASVVRRAWECVQIWGGVNESAGSGKMPFSEHRDPQKCSCLSLDIKQSISVSTILLFTMICSIKQGFLNSFLVFYKSSSSGFFISLLRNNIPW